MFEKVKKALRLSNNALDDDLKRNIDAALLDMGRVGVGADKTENELAVQCVVLYCKWIYNFMGKGDDYLKAYERLRDAMSMCEEYR